MNKKKETSLENETDRIEFNCPRLLLEDFDRVWPRYYPSRTAALHDLMRKFLDTWKPKEPVKS